MKKIFQLLISIFLLVNLSYAQKLWEQKADYTGTARNSSMAFSINGKAYLGLGHNYSSTKLYDFYEYNPSTNSWTKKTNYPGGGSFTTCAFAMNGKGYVFMGANNSGTPQKDVWEYDPNSDKWTQKGNFPGSARYGASWFVINDTAFVFTGSQGGTPYLYDVWMYVPATDKWTQKSNFPGGSRLHGAAFTINGVGYFGTGIKNSTTATKDVWRYNKSNDTWTQIADYPNGATTGAIGFEVEGSGYIGTGYDLSKISKDIYEFVPATNSWSKMDSIPSSQSVRGGAVTFKIDKTLYISTGYYSISGGYAYSLTDLWAYTPKSKCYTNIISEPQNTTVIVNENAVFNIKTDDTTANYKWQINKGYGFSDITNGGQYSGADTKQLTISKVKLNLNNGNKIRCIATGKTCIDTSNIVALTVKCPILIKTEPNNQSAYVDENIKFNIEAVYSISGYIWQIDEGSGYINVSNAGRYSGATKDTLTISNILVDDNKSKFRCFVLYEGCVDTSAEVKINVICKSIIKKQPIDVTVYQKSQANFIVKAYQNGTIYHWKSKINGSFEYLSNSGQYSGTTSDSLTIDNVSQSNNQQEIKCMFYYKGCLDSSNVVKLKVLCNSLVISEPNSLSKYEGEIALFTTGSIDPNVSFSWQRDKGTGYYNLNNSGNIIGANNDSLIVSNLQLSDNNQKFRCILSSEGCFDTTEAVLLNVSCKKLISVQPLNKSEYVNNNTYLSVNSYEKYVNYQWQSDIGFGFNDLSDAGQYKGSKDDTLKIENLTFSNNNQKFRCIIKSGACTEITDEVSLKVECMKLVLSQPSNRNGINASSVFFNVSSTHPITNYQWQTDIGLGFQNISNAGQYSGANKDTLKITDLSTLNNNQVFRCVLSNTNCKDTTNNVTLKVTAYIEKQMVIDNFIFYPNPCSKILFIKISQIGKNNLFALYNSTGQLILNQKLSKLTTEINVDTLSSGLYFIRYIYDNTTQTKNLFIAR